MEKQSIFVKISVDLYFSIYRRRNQTEISGKNIAIRSLRFIFSLYNEASYKTTDGRTVLYLEGNQRSYAETPAIPIQKISFSLLCWVKVLSLPGHHVHIYSDWSSPFQFRLHIDAEPQLCVNLRRPDSQSKSIVAFCAG